MLDDEVTALGIVVDDDRGSLPFLLVHGEALVAAAAWALGEAGVTLLDGNVPWSSIREADEPLVLHDSLCPLTPPEFLQECVERCHDTGTVVVGTRPVTDTVKHVADGLVAETVDRESLLAVCSPVVLPATVLHALEALPSTDFAELVSALGARWPLVTLEAPSAAARVGGADDVRLLEALGSS